MNHRNEYRNLINEAARLGWTPATLRSNAEHLAAYYQGKGESAGEAWVSAAREAISVERERREA